MAQRLREVSRGLRLPVEITFAEYAAGHWATYISQNLKPSTQASHRKDAERILAQRLREVNSGLRRPVEITFAEYAAGHWATYISQNLKPSTQASHRSNVKAHLLPMFGKRRLSEISPVHVMDLLKDKAAAGLKPKSPLNLYVLLQKMLNLAVALELLNSNPMQRVPKPKAERTEKPYLSPTQVKDIADNMPQNLRALVVLLYLTGLRIGEALALKWSDEDFDQSKLHVRRSVWRGKEETPKSRKSIRAKHLLDGLARALKSHRELCVSRKPEDYLFVNGAGRSYDPAIRSRRRVSLGARASGLRVTSTFSCSPIPKLSR
ncbi:MAG: tyrosine-type recombinase/integrase [Candidatus Sulfotelmatobacter sp.]